jgi:peptide/nickel transport system ATP-binding protein
MLDSYPHQLSGGQQQRIVIAMALMSKPSLLILDEPTTALDVTVEAAVVELVKDLGKKYGTSMLFISHNLGLVLETCDRLCVMYSGEAVETGSIEDVFDKMQHPYTQALFRSIPLPGADKNARPLVAIPGNFPLPHERPPGCNFGPRCDYFEAGPLRRAGHPDVRPCPATTATPRAACVRGDRLERADPWPRHADRKGRDRRCRSQDRQPQEILRGRGQRAVRRRRDKKVVKANETLSFEARERNAGHRGRIGLRQVHLRQGADGAGDGDRRQILLDNRHRGHTPIETATPRRVARSRWCSRTRSTRSTRR